MSDRPPLTITYRSPADLIPYAKNPRTHSEAQIAQLTAAILEYGFTNPILIDERKALIAGHGRLAAAIRAGLKKIPTITLAGLTDDQRRALVIADNKLALNAGWDVDVLKVELADLQIGGFDLGLTGFSTLELTDLFATREGRTDPDDVPEVAAPITRTGEVWIMGPHRLVCGDSTDEATVNLCLKGARPHLMVTDPPYGIEYDAAWRDEWAKKYPSMGNRKDTAKGVVKNDDRSDWTAAWKLFSGDVVYCWHADLRANSVFDSLNNAGFEIRAQIIWCKQHIAFGRGHYHFQHEPCWYAVRKGGTGHWHGDRKQSTVWQIDKPQKSETGHSTQKPVECMKRPIENNSVAGDAVYEPFSGSGTTIVACEMTGRSCHAIELNPAYVDMGVRRWQSFTGKIATLESTGQSFADIEAQRRQAAA